MELRIFELEEENTGYVEADLSSKSKFKLNFDRLCFYQAPLFQFR